MAEDNMNAENKGFFREDEPHGDYSGNIGEEILPDGKHQLDYKKGSVPIRDGMQVQGLSGTETVSVRRTAEHNWQLQNPTATSPQQSEQNISNIQDYQNPSTDQQPQDEAHVAAGDR